MCKKEIWLPVVGYEGFYEVSNLLRVRSVGRFVNCINGTKRFSPGKVLKPTKIADGYRQVSLCADGIVKNKHVHRLAMEAFVPNPDNLPEIDHIVPLANGGTDTLDNLRWVTRKENANNQISLKNKSEAQLKVSSKKSQSMKGKCDKELLQYDLEHNLVNTYYGIKKTCLKKRWNYSTISSAMHKKTTAYGFYWKSGRRVRHI